MGGGGGLGLSKIRACPYFGKCGNGGLARRHAVALKIEKPGAKGCLGGIASAGWLEDHQAYTKKLLVSGREAPENLTRSVGLFFLFWIIFFILCRPLIEINTQDMHAPKHHCLYLIRILSAIYSHSTDYSSYFAIFYRLLVNNLLLNSE